MEGRHLWESVGGKHGERAGSTAGCGVCAEHNESLFSGAAASDSARGPGASAAPSTAPPAASPFQPGPVRGVRYQWCQCLLPRARKVLFSAGSGWIALICSLWVPAGSGFSRLHLRLCRSGTVPTIPVCQAWMRFQTMLSQPKQDQLTHSAHHICWTQLKHFRVDFNLF